jgi:hypothetical protein
VSGCDLHAFISILVMVLHQGRQYIVRTSIVFPLGHTAKMGHPLEFVMKYLVREIKAGEVTTTDNNASSEIPVPNLMLMRPSAM